MNLVKSFPGISMMNHYIKDVQMLFAPELIVLVIGATRMYRALSVHFTDTVE